jgi:multimeric flavodoxin WrbA
MKITPCQGCLKCRITEKCQINDDMYKNYEKISRSDGIIFATPVYMWSMTGQAKVFLDRTYSLQNKLANKVGGVISVATRQGNSNTINLFTHYFISNNMFVAGYVDTLANKKGTAFNDKRGMKACYELGRKMYYMIKKKYSFPENYDRSFREIVAKKYGVTIPYPI